MEIIWFQYLTSFSRIVSFWQKVEKNKLTFTIMTYSTSNRGFFRWCFSAHHTFNTCTLLCCNLVPANGTNSTQMQIFKMATNAINAGWSTNRFFSIRFLSGSAVGTRRGSTCTGMFPFFTLQTTRSTVGGCVLSSYTRCTCHNKRKV